MCCHNFVHASTFTCSLMAPISSSSCDLLCLPFRWSSCFTACSSLDMTLSTSIAYTPERKQKLMKCLNGVREKRDVAIKFAGQPPWCILPTFRHEEGVLKRFKCIEFTARNQTLTKKSRITRSYLKDQNKACLRPEITILNLKTTCRRRLR